MAGKPRVTLPPRRTPVAVTPIPRPPRPEVPLHERIAVSISGFAELSSTSGPTVRVLLKQGLPHIRAGAASGRVLIPVEAARRWLVSQAVSLIPEAAELDYPDDGEGADADDLPEPTHIGEPIREVVHNRLRETGVAELDQMLQGEA